MTHPETHENLLNYLWRRALAGIHMKTFAAIFEANKDQLSDPNKIQIGQILKIPKS